MSEGWLDIAYWLRATKYNGKDISICIKNNEAIAIALSPTFDADSYGIQSPITTLLHNIGVSNSEDSVVVSTAVPSKMCKGMAQLFGVKEIWYSDDNKLKELSKSGKDYRTIDRGTYVEPSSNASINILENLKKTKEYGALKPRRKVVVPDDIGDLPLAKLVVDRAVLDKFFTLVTLDIARNSFGGGGVIGSVRTQGNGGKNIASLLVDADGAVISWGVNTNTTEKWQHAEVNTLYNLLEAGYESIPKGSTLYTTLEPCGMCAGLISHLGRNSMSRVIAAMTDPTLGQTELRGTTCAADVTMPAVDKKLVIGSIAGGGSCVDVVEKTLNGYYDEWRKTLTKDTRMTQFFNTACFLSASGAARSMWFQVLWQYLEAKFKREHAAFCDAHAGKPAVKGVWGKPGTDAVAGLKLSEMAKMSQYESALSDLSFMYRNLDAVFEAFNRFLATVASTLVRT
jgi:tRNA(Arg) A34 adenosine deaminase TadA